VCEREGREGEGVQLCLGRGRGVWVDGWGSSLSLFTLFSFCSPLDPRLCMCRGFRQKTHTRPKHGSPKREPEPGGEG